MEYKRCKQCGRKILKCATMSIKRYNTLQFCSKKCFYNSKKLVNECRNCGKEIITTHKANKQFCNNECRIEWYKTERLKCSFCGEPIEPNTPLKFGRKHFCSHKCFIKEFGKDNINYCERCGLPLYNNCGNHKDYKKTRKHKHCKKYMGY